MHVNGTINGKTYSSSLQKPVHLIFTEGYSMIKCSKPVFQRPEFISPSNCTKVVAKNQVTVASAPATVPSGDSIGVAAKALSKASYPFLKDIV